MTDLAAAHGLSKSTVHRMITALSSAGFIEQDLTTKLLRPGLELFLVGSAAADCFSIIHLAQPVLASLAERTGDTAFLSLPVGYDYECVARRIGSFPIKALTLEIGDRRPLGVGSGGLALLAFRSDDEVEAVVTARAAQLSTFPRFAPAELRQLVETSRRQRHVLIDGHVVAGMSAVALPILDHRRRAVAAISIAAISERMQPGRRRGIVALLRAEVERMEQKLAPIGDSAFASRVAS